jgi:hypothetical protein
VPEKLTMNLHQMLAQKRRQRDATIENLGRAIKYLSDTTAFEVKAHEAEIESLEALIAAQTQLLGLEEVA